MEVKRLHPECISCMTKVHLEKCPKEMPEDKLLNEFESDVTETTELATTAIQAMNKGDMVTAFGVMQTQMLTKADEMEAGAEKLTKLEIKRANEASDKAQETYYIAINGTIFLLIEIVVLIILAFIIIERSVVRPLKRASDELHIINESLRNKEGDLTRRLPVKSKDEIGLLAYGMNNFLDILQKIVSKLGGGSDELMSLIGNVNQNIGDSNSNATEVSNRLEELAASMEEVSSTIHAVSEGTANIGEEVDAISEQSTNIASYSREMDDRATELANTARENKDEANNMLRGEGLRAGIERFGEFANILFLKLISESEQIKRESGIPTKFDIACSWDSIKQIPSSTRIEYINKTVYDKLNALYNTDIFTPLQIRDASILKEIMDKLDPLMLTDVDSDVKGDAFEYFLKARLLPKMILANILLLVISSRQWFA